MAQKLDANLNVIQETPIELELINGDLSIISMLDDEPNDVGGLTSSELKAKFDEAGNIIKNYINNSLVPSVLAADATEATRSAAEAERVENEQERVANENARVPAEEIRIANEAQRVSAEDSRVMQEVGRKLNEMEREEAEKARIGAESGREEAELQRHEQEALRYEEEIARKRNESQRISAESLRDDDETLRKNAENVRVIRESNRASAESNRVTAENNRNSQEQTRQSNELSRISAEQTRASNEAQRVQNENAREDLETGYVARAEAAAQRAEKAAAEAEGVAGGESDVFIAEYGVTTSAEIEAAYQAGKAIFLNYTGETNQTATIGTFFRRGDATRFEFRVLIEMEDDDYNVWLREKYPRCWNDNWVKDAYGNTALRADIHASQHKAGGADPITPASIGAATLADIKAAIGNAIAASY